MLNLRHDPTCPTWTRPERKNTLRNKLAGSKIAFHVDTDTGAVTGHVPDTFRN